MDNRISVVMSVYKNDKAPWFSEAVKSVVYQSLRPSEIVVVLDGPVAKSVEDTLADWMNREPGLFKVVRLKENSGLGIALQKGIEETSYELIARMDSDDISESNRFEQQVSYFNRHPETDIVGGQISEFFDGTEEHIGDRLVPCTDSMIKDYMKRRCPMNHVSVMMKKESVITVGGYRDWPYNEDYDLWIRMAYAGMVFSNLNSILVNVRVDKDMYARRGGYSYFKSEFLIQQEMMKLHIIGFSRFISNVFIRFFAQLVVPNSIRALLYKLLRWLDQRHR